MNYVYIQKKQQLKATHENLSIMNWLSYLARQQFSAESTEREALIPIQISDVRFSPWLWSLENSSARNIRSLFGLVQPWHRSCGGGARTDAVTRPKFCVCSSRERSGEGPGTGGLEEWSDAPPPSSSHLRALHRRAHTPLHELLISSERARIHWIIACLSCFSRSGCVQRSWRSGFRVQHPDACMCARRSPNMSSVSPVSLFNPHPAARLCPPPATANTRTGFIDGSSAEMNDFANLDVTKLHCNFF